MVLVDTTRSWYRCIYKSVRSVFTTITVIMDITFSLKTQMYLKRKSEPAPSEEKLGDLRLFGYETLARSSGDWAGAHNRQN